MIFYLNFLLIEDDLMFFYFGAAPVVRIYECQKN